MPFPSPCFLSPFLLSLCPLFSLSPSCCHFPSQPPFLLCPQLPSLCFCKCHSPVQATTASRGVRFPSELQRQAVNLMELFPARPTLFMNASFTCLCAWSVGWMAFSLYPQRWLSSVAPRLNRSDLLFSFQDERVWGQSSAVHWRHKHVRCPTFWRLSGEWHHDTVASIRGQ